MVAVRLSADVALATSGQRPQFVNHAVKGAYVLRLLEAVPGVADKLPAARTIVEESEGAVTSAQRAKVLVIAR